MRIITMFGLGAVVIASVAAAACSSSSTSSNPTTQSYTQIERLARPAVKEAFEAYQRHDQTNRSSPFADPILPGDITSFMTGAGSTANRSGATATALVGVLIPDVMISDLSQSGVGAAYLGVETGGATGSKFGGRGLHDDVIATDLSAIFGNTLSALGLVADDGAESPCLANDNVPYGSSGGKHDTTTFPYVGAPR